MSRLVCARRQGDVNGS
ncbi:Protein of unknown function, partial [Gryllus bimaculatus]